MFFDAEMSVILFQGPQPEDRAQVSAEDVRLPNSLSTALSTQDTQIVSLISAYVASSFSWYRSFCLSCCVSLC